MSLLRTLSKIRGGYPGGWRKYARGTAGTETPPFKQPNSPDDRRSLIPSLGLKEYWYPALPAKAVPSNKPVGLRLLGTDLVLFRDKAGEVRALWDYCPHRGAYLSFGDCFWKGYVSCPYHGATFDGAGECVEFITEGPDSKMVGRLKARAMPTRTLKGLVFVWMGDGDPAPIEDDVPPEFFEKKTVVQQTFRYWKCNWIIALENTGDAHNMFYVHRNSFRELRTRRGGRPRTPVGYRVQIVDNVSVQRLNKGDASGTEGYYGANGKAPYQLYHPRVGGYWPKQRWRLLWSWIFEPFERRRLRKPRIQNPPRWEGQRLPGMVRNNHHTHIYTRWGVPVEQNLTRAVYFYTTRPKTVWGQIYDRLAFNLILKWMYFFNFSDQDYDAMRSIRYQYPEFLSSTDNPVVALRKLVTEYARGVNRSTASEVTTAEQLVREADELLGVRPDVGVPSPAAAGEG